MSTFGGHAYDAFLILTEAVKSAGSVDRGKVRDAIEGLKGLPGTAGIFNFSPDRPQRPHDRRVRDAHREERRVRALQEVGATGAWGRRSSSSTCWRGSRPASVYAVVAIGFTIVYNATGIINFAQGEFLMLGGMIAISLARVMPLPVAIAVAVLRTGLRGRACCRSCSFPG